MADFQHLTLPTPSPDFGLTLAAPQARALLRGGEAVAEQAGRLLGLVWPQKPCTSCVAGSSVLWLGPDEWLVLGTEIALAKLSEGLTGLPHSLVDISHRQIALEIRGRLAAGVLNAGCPLDLHPTAFPAGMVARTLFQKAEIVLWRRATDVFHIEIWRSFAPYVVDHMTVARDGLAGL